MVAGGTTRHPHDSLYDSGEGLDLLRWSCFSEFLVKVFRPSYRQSLLVTPRSLVTHTTHTFFSLSLPLGEAARRPQRHHLSAAAHHLPFIIHTVSPSFASNQQGPERDETRRGQAGPVETVRDARHRTTPTCGLRRRSSRHHRSPPNLGTTTQLSAQQRQRQGIVNRLSRTVPLRVRAPVWTNSFSSWPTRPTHTGSSTVGSTYYLPTFCTRGRPCVCRAAARLGTAEAATTARGAG